MKNSIHLIKIASISLIFLFGIICIIGSDGGSGGGSGTYYDCSDPDYTVDAYVGTSLEGANACPPVVLPENLSSNIFWEDELNDLANTHDYKGFLPPVGYDEIGSKAALKILKESNYDNTASWRPESVTRRFESTTIDVYLNNVQDAAEAIKAIGDALEGVISFNIVDSTPEVGIVFKYISERCGYAAESWNRQDEDFFIHSGLWTVYLNEVHDCGNYRVNLAIHEIFHALGYIAHSAIRNTTMTVGGIWNDHQSAKGQIDDFTISVIKNLYSIPPGTPLN